MKKLMYGWHLDGDKVRKGYFWDGGKPVRVYDFGWIVALLLALFGWGLIDGKGSVNDKHRPGALVNAISDG